MPPTITSEVVVAYAVCPRKAYLLLFSPEQGEPHEYVRILERQRVRITSDTLTACSISTDVQPYTWRPCATGARCCSTPVSRLRLGSGV